MTAQRDGERSIETSDLPKMHTTKFFESKEELAQYANAILTRSDPEEILQSITITKLERFEGRCVTAAIMCFLVVS